MRTLLALAIATASLLPAEEVNRPAKELAIHMNEGGEMLLSSYRGKVVCVGFFYTTCPHCQAMSRLLQRVQAEYKPKGVQVIAAAFNDDARMLVPEFNQKFVQGAFPLGYSDRGAVLEFLEKSIMTPLLVPIMVFVDRKGNIVDQYIGDEVFLQDPEKSVRAELDKILLKSPAGKTMTKAVSKTGAKMVSTAAHQ